VILLENHGIITLGRSPDVKGRHVYGGEGGANLRGSAALGGPQFLSEENIRRIVDAPTSITVKRS
jgi:hypothetical protein